MELTQLRGFVTVARMGSFTRAAEALFLSQPAMSLQVKALERKLEGTSFTLDRLMKKTDDLLWFQRVGDVAEVDKVYLPTVPNPRAEETYGITNERHPFKMWAYVLVPRDLDRSRKHPLLVFPHGGVHADFTTYYTHIVRELMDEGYVVVAPEYRGSTGYGKEFVNAGVQLRAVYGDVLPDADLGVSGPLHVFAFDAQLLEEREGECCSVSRFHHGRRTGIAQRGRPSCRSARRRTPPDRATRSSGFAAV